MYHTVHNYLIKSSVYNSNNDMEIMVHRRLLVDDHWGVDEALNETAFGEVGLVARGKHYLLFDLDMAEAYRRTRLLANELYGQPLITFDLEKGHKKNKSLSSSVTGLPENVNLLTLEPISPNKIPEENNFYLLRFEHIFDIDEHPLLSLPVKVSLTKFVEEYFDMEINSIRETTLGGNRFKEDSVQQRLKWGATSSSDETSNQQLPLERKMILMKHFDEIELQPMEIRTFQIELL